LAQDLCCSLIDAKVMLGITLSDTSFDAILTLIITDISAVIQERLGRTILLAPNSRNPITVYLNGTSAPALVLNDRPVQAPLYTGTTTLGSAVVTGMSSTTYVFANACVASANLPTSSYVVSVGNGTVTLNQAATASGSCTLLFGPAVWLDNGGFYGTAQGAFAANTQMFEGVNFVLRRDQDGGTSSRSGVLEVIGAGGGGLYLGGWGGWGGGWARNWPMLTGYPVAGQGNVKVTYTAGWETMPQDLQLVALRVLAKVRLSTVWGQIISSQSYEGASTSLVQAEAKTGLLSGDVGPLLARWANAF